MTGFSTHWLALREPIDHESRSIAVKNAMINELRRVHGRSLSRLSVIDLGCGSGSNLRALSPLLGREQFWTLVDYDPVLLDAARHAIAQWADVVVSDTAQAFTVRKGVADIHIEFLQADLSAQAQTILTTRKADLVTASALFDLVSEQWLTAFCAALKSPLYTVLTYDGRMQWAPTHKSDEAVVDAFNAHQLTDKGFGPAAGWKATQTMQALFEARGASVVVGDSTWHLGAQESSLHQQLLQGIASAVAETGLVSVPDLNDWLGYRLEAISGRIGHQDLFVAFTQG